MAVQYRVVLDGIEISDEEKQQLERDVQDVVRRFLESKRGGGPAAADEGGEIVTDAEEVTKRLSDIGGGLGGGTTMGIIYRPPDEFVPAE